MVPLASAADMKKTDDQNDIITLFAPIDSEIKETINVKLNEGRNLKWNMSQNSEKMILKYQENLDLIIQSLENETGKKLSLNQKENLKRIIIQEHIKKVSWDLLKKKMGVKEEDFKPIFLGAQNSSDQQVSQTLYMPNSLKLVQVSVDVYGGTGRDGANLPYTVNGGNQLYRIDWNTGSGYTLYQCRFRDEDVPDSPYSDAVYDAYRLRVYGTIEDTQGFFIYTKGVIEFGNDWDNGKTYGYIIGQHGQITRPFGSSTRIYVSNVWNHAMDIYDRNQNMAKVYYYY